MFGPAVGSNARWSRWIVSCLRTAGLVWLLALCAGCHEQGDVKVTAITFEGNSRFTDAQLRSVLATKKSGWLPWAKRHYLDRAEFEADLKRLVAFYADRGYPHAKIAGLDVKMNAARDAVRLSLKIDEGTPLTVEQVRLQGFDDLPDDLRRALGDLPVKVGQPRDREFVRGSRDLAARLLRDHGYAHAAVQASEEPGTTADQVVVVLRAEPGPKAYFGDVAITGLNDVGEQVVRRELTFKSGDLFQESKVTRSQRRLASLELFEFAHVDPRVTENKEATTIPVRVTVAEGPPRRLKLGLGYGSEEQVRGTVEWKHLNFFGNARQASFESKWSSLDRGLRFNVLEPYFLRPRLSLNMNAQAWRTDQLTYQSQTYGGRATIAFHTDHGLEGPREPTHYEARVAYVNEYLRYGIRKESLGDLSMREERIALGLDPDTGQAAGTLGGIDMDFERIGVDDPLNPHRGTSASVHLQHVAPWLGGTYRYNELVLDGKAFVPITRTVVLATRGRMGTLAAASPTSIPFSERYFLGGSSSIRGWGRFQVSPLDPHGLPIGGRSLFEFSAELRAAVRGPVGAVLFFDAGNVWADEWQFDLGDLRKAAGVGVRYGTPIGAVRADFGYQLNPIAELIINGKPEKRRWRVHFSIGQSF